MKIIAHSLIKNKWIFTHNSKSDVYSLADNSLIGTISTIDNKNINVAIDSAYHSFNSERNIDYKYREIILRKMIVVLRKNKKYLSNIMCHEIGKKYIDCEKEIERSIEYIFETIKYFKTKFINCIKYNHKDLNDSKKSAIYKKIPIGIVLCITPFNYPINLLISKIAPAILTGNYVIIKPAFKGSLVTYEFIRLLKQTINFNDILQLIIGDSKLIGTSLVSSNKLAMINFTGSSTIGNEIVKVATTKNFILEMGGKDVGVVMEDANIDVAVKKIINGAFNYNGQRCTAIKRVVVHDKIFNKFISKLNENVSSIKCGSPFDKNILITPLINDKSINFAKELFRDAKLKKAKIHHDLDIKNNLLKPIIISNVKTNMKIWRYEQFCPILPIMSYKDKNELIKLINDSEYGLQCSIFTRNINNVMSLFEYIDVATVNINKSSSRGPDILPFFGIKNSGHGIQGIQYAIESMVTLKGLVINKD